MVVVFSVLEAAIEQNGCQVREPKAPGFRCEFPRPVSHRPNELSWDILHRFRGLLPNLLLNFGGNLVLLRTDI
jgi:hypothetical protein